MDGPYKPSAISNIARQVPPEFRRVLSDAQRSTKKGEGCTTIQNHDIEESFEQYQLWAGNLGALHDPEDPRSLDYRLRDAVHVKHRILELLEELLNLFQGSMFELRSAVLLSPQLCTTVLSDEKYAKY